MENNQNRSFIIDFVCCLPFGHNLQCVNNYMEREERRGQTAKAIVCRQIASIKNINLDGFHCTLPAIYKKLFNITEKNRLKKFYRQTTHRILSLPVFRSILFFTAARATKQIFNTHKLGKNDLVIFPSADYYGVRAFIKYLSKVKKEERPRLHLRFIGVAESNHLLFYNNIYELVDLINQNHQTITVSSEVPIYAQYLNSVLPNISVITEPYPLKDQVRRSRKKSRSETWIDPFTILLPGTNRADKGYFDLYNLAKEIFFQIPSIRIIIQDMSKRDDYFDKTYQLKLSRIANVELVDAVLPREKIETLYEQADLILLPYDPGVYYFRGSAIHYEAIVNRIPVLVRKGVAFSDEVEQWSSGWLYETKQDLIFRLKEILKTKPGSIEKKMNAAMLNFKKSSDEAANIYLS